ncbi:unnamed protein product [Ceratitis capitata]|uniref:(Mediterranean fruit fly) hypothetical protein n=1 Tax=Ceratitis capitata TaxID=7213 RepID=A0A811VHI0_CERCA|nr:unnamed protein product [Ceratitis capitata]
MYIFARNQSKLTITSTTGRDFHSLPLGGGHFSQILKANGSKLAKYFSFFLWLQWRGESIDVGKAGGQCTYDFNLAPAGVEFAVCVFPFTFCGGVPYTDLPMEDKCVCVCVCTYGIVRSLC